MEPIGKKIRTAREKIKMTQTELAKKAGISKIYLCRIETGKRQKCSRLLEEKIFEILNEPASPIKEENLIRKLTDVYVKAITSKDFNAAIRCIELLMTLNKK